MQSVYSRLTAMCSGWVPCRLAALTSACGWAGRAGQRHGWAGPGSGGHGDNNSGGLAVEEEDGELEVAAREGVVERGAAAAVLAVVRVGAALDEHPRNLDTQRHARLVLAVARGDLV